MTDTTDTSNYTPADEPDIAPALERFSSPQDVAAKATGDLSASEQAVIQPAPDAEESAEITADADGGDAAPAEGKAPGKVFLDDEEYEAEEIKSWRDAHKQQSTFDRLYREKRTELKGVYETLVSEEQRINSEKAQLAEERAQLDQYRRYLIRQGVEAGDSFSEEIGNGMDLDGADAPRSAKKAPKALTEEDFERMYTARREKERAVESEAASRDRIRRGFDKWVDDSLDHAGLEKNTPSWRAVRKAVAFDFYTKFSDDPHSVTKLDDGEISSLLRNYAREYGREFRQTRERDLDTAATALSGKKLPVTPRNPGTPLPDQASPARRKDTFQRLENEYHGDLDAYFDAVRQDSLRMADELNRKG